MLPQALQGNRFAMNDVVTTLLTSDDLYLFNEGRSLRLYEKLGAHRIVSGDRDGIYFAVWAPDAEAVSVIGDFNGWQAGRTPLQPRGESGIWEGFVAGLGVGAVYKYHIRSRLNGYTVEKADPLATRTEVPPRTASIVWDLDYEWRDGGWMAGRAGRQNLGAPISIYELHLASWRRVREEGWRSLNYRELAEPLADYLTELGFTHLELLPIMEHPFGGSWGYQTTGFFAPTSRFGTPQDLMFLIDTLHQRGIGVILDWVASHFPTDQHGLGYFDGSHLYEHYYPEKGFHPEWSSFIFNYGRNEVRSFLLSSALFWLDRYHVDGFRVDAVASMLYLDYARKPGEWMANRYGGHENLEAIDFLRRFNEDVHLHYPDTLTIAEESTAWPMVSRPTCVGGLGFDLKWDMGWMHDTLQYFSRDPIHRRYHHGELTFRGLYAFHENFVLPLSHDEVVHGKGALLAKMPGDDWQKFANLRLLFGYMWAQSGKKLLFMGGEIGQWHEWFHDASIDWRLAEYERHAGIQRLVADLNRLYRDEPALHLHDCDASGFQWIDADDADHSVLAFLRRGDSESEVVLVVCNFTPMVWRDYRIGVPHSGRWRELLNSDSSIYGGSDQGNCGGVDASTVSYQGQRCSLALTIPPLAVIFLKPERS
jgi:1,4-alpha-glucan branching enzyme